MKYREQVVESVSTALSGPCALADGVPIVAACSGGADSVGLVWALGQLAPRWPLRAVVFVDHGLREVTAEREAAGAIAEAQGAPFIVAAVQVPSQGNLQQQARRARYEALAGVAGHGGVIATGHTQTDQAETVLQRLVRGAGLRGLAAIGWRHGRCVRPLLGVSREVMRELGLRFVDDPTNETNAFARNRLRRQVMPLLAAENPAVEAALSSVAQQAAAELELLDALAEALELRFDDLRDMPQDTAEAIVRWRLRREQGHKTPGRAPVRALARALIEGHPRGRVSLGHGLEGRAEAGKLSFAASFDARSRVVAHSCGTYRVGTMTVELAPCGAGEAGARPAAGRRYRYHTPDSMTWPLTIQHVPRSQRMKQPARRVESREVASDHDRDGRKQRLEQIFLLTDAMGVQLKPMPIETGAASSTIPAGGIPGRSLTLTVVGDP